MISLAKILAIVATYGLAVPVGHTSRLAVGAVGKLCPIESSQYPGYEVEDADDELYDHTFPA